MSAKYTLRFNISRPVGVVAEPDALNVTAHTAGIIDEHCIVTSQGTYKRVTASVWQVTVEFLAANEAEAKAISYDGLSGGVQGTGVAVDTITLTSGSGRVTL